MRAPAQTAHFFALTARSVRPFPAAGLLCYASGQVTWTLPVKVSLVSVSLASARMADMLQCSRGNLVSLLPNAHRSLIWIWHR